MVTPSIEIHLLGPVEIIQGDKLISLNRRVERMILYILAVEQRPVSRTTLMDMLWPEADQTDPRGTFRTALSRLRRKLPDVNLILTELDNVHLDLSRCKIDLITFQNSFLSIVGALNTSQNHQLIPPQILNQIQTALSLWRGDSLIQGENLSAYTEISLWHQSHDQRVKKQRSTLLKKLAEHYEASGQPELALEHFRELGNFDILDVSIHLKTLDLLFLLGHSQEAVEYCDYLEVKYEQEYSAPLPATLLEKCCHYKDQIKTLEDKQRIWPLPLTMNLPLVGRKKELNQLRKAFFKGGIALLRGGLGTGKTRLMQELFFKLENINCFVAPSFEIEKSLPYAPIIYGLRHHISKEIWKEIDPIWAYQLQRLLPELNGIREDIQNLNKSQLAFRRQNIFEALQQLLQLVVTKEGRLLFFLDDAHWADTQTLQAISYLISNGFFDSHGLLVLAFEQGESNPIFEDIVNRLYSNRNFQIIELDNLNPEELRSLVEHVFQAPASTDFIVDLYQRTEGNPFISLEAIRPFLETPDEINALIDLDSLAIPESIQALIIRRFRKLDQASKHILLCAALLGNSFSFELLQSISGIKILSDNSSIESLIEYGFFIPLTGSEQINNTWQFAHERIREVVLQQAPPLSLQVIHRQIAKQYANEPTFSATAYSIADHYLSAGDIIPAYHWFIKAAEHAWSLGAKEDATKAFQEAEVLFNQNTNHPFSTDEILTLYDPWRTFAYESSQIDLLEEIGLILQYLGEHQSSPLLLGVSYITLSNACFLRSRINTAQNLIQRAIENLVQTEYKKYLAQAYQRYGIYCWLRMAYECSLSAFALTRDLCSGLDPSDPETIEKQFSASQMTSLTYFAKGDVQKTFQHAQEAYDSYYDQLNTYDKIVALVTLSRAYSLTGNYLECKRTIQKASEISDLLKNDYLEEYIHLIRAQACVNLGELDQAYQDASFALASGTENNRIHSIVLAHNILGDIFFILQQTSLALQHYRIAQIREGFPVHSIEGLENNLSLARILAWMGHLDEAKRIIHNTLEITEEKDMQALHTQALIISGYCDLFGDDLTSAALKINQASEDAARLELIHEIVWCKKVKVRLALSGKDLQAAEHLIIEVLNESHQHNFRWIFLNAWVLYSELMEMKDQTTIPDRRRLIFEEVFSHLEEHTQIEALRGYLDEARKIWTKGLPFP